MKKGPVLLATVSALIATQGVFAKQPFALDPSIITATGMRESLLLSPASVTQLERYQIERAPVADAAELFRDIPGVTLADSDTPGMKRISIRGESSRRVAIKIDGQTMTDHSTYGSPLLIDPATIERIEVIRGPSSVINGSNAIGGVVNIITRGGGDKPLEAHAGAGYYSATQGYRSSAGLGGSLNGFDYRLALSRSEHGDRRVPDGTLDHSDYDNESVSAHLGYRWANQHLALKAEQFNLSANTWTDPAPGEQLTLAFPERDQTRYAFFYQAEGVTDWLSRLSLDGLQRQVDRTFTNSVAVSGIPSVAVDNLAVDDLRTRGLTLKAEMDLLANQPTLAGIEYLQDQLNADKHTSTTTLLRPGLPPVSSSRSSVQEAEQSTLSAFVQQRWQFAPDWTGHLGGRYYVVESDLKRSTDRSQTDSRDERWLGSLGLVHQLQGNWSLRATYAGGYSYPTLTQLFSVATGGSDVHYGNAELKPELARTVELGLRHESSLAALDVALYRTDAKDYIDRQRLSVTPDGFLPPSSSRLRQWQYVNVDEARSHGLEVALQWRAELLLKPYASFSLARRTFHFGNHSSTRHSGLAEASGTLGLRHFSLPRQGWLSEVDLYMRASEGATREDDQGLVSDQAGGFATLNLNWKVDYQERVSVSLLLGNLLNRNYRPLDELPGAQRHADLEATLHF
ncbi:TonB-dependent receptor plug domain-containing protein [Halopseudomonas pelagia]|uniref:TonB-dependent receptor plug domain-containing protein n=1 Tax=Halopseudomonas pelagia TaxID=553151 RepID=UPI00039FB798|nr:TonB-dependent receptor [Halopseudomonas pelagia]